MSAVVKAGVGLVVVAGLGLGVGPNFIGAKGEEAYKAYLASLEKFGITAELEYYNRTWFSSQARYRLTLNENAPFGADEIGELLETVTVTDDIQHGPLLPYMSGVKPGLISFTSKLEVDQAKLAELADSSEATLSEIEEGLLKGSEGRPLLEAMGYLGFDQKINSRFKTAQLNYQEDWGNLSVTPLIADVVMNMSRTEYSAQYQWSGMTFKNADEGSLSVKGMSGEEKGVYVQPMFWDADGQISFKDIKAVFADSNLGIETLNVSFDSDVSEETYGGTLDVELNQLKTDAYQVDQFRMAYGLENVSIEKTKAVADVFRKASEEAEGANEEMQVAIVQRLIAENHQLFFDLAEGVQFNISEISMKTAQGQLDGNLHLEIGEIPQAVMQNPLLTVNSIVGDASLKFDKALVPEAQQEALNMPIMMGFLKVEDTALVSALKLSEGTLEVNGQKFPLGAMFAQNAPAPATAPSSEETHANEAQTEEAAMEEDANAETSAEKADNSDVPAWETQTQPE